MVKRIGSFMLLLILVVGISNVRPAPAAAATNVLPNAQFFPPDTIFYTNLNIATLDKTLDFVSDIDKKFFNSQYEPYQFFDDWLTRVMQRPASYKKDIKPWLGDNVTIGVLSKGGTNTSPTRIITVIDVKDQAIGDKFVTELTNLYKKSIDTLKTKGGDSLKVYKIPNDAPYFAYGTIIQGKGFYAVDLYGDNDSSNFTDILTGKTTSTLADNVGFRRTGDLLNPDSTLIMYFLPHYFMQGLIPDTTYATPDPKKKAARQALKDAAEALIKTVDGFALSLGWQDKSLLLDGVVSLNLPTFKAKYAKLVPAYKAYYGNANPPPEIDFSLFNLPPLSDTTLKQIPANAVASSVVTGRLYSAYDSYKHQVDQILQNAENKDGFRYNPYSPKQIEIFRAIKQAFDLNFDEDIKALAVGEYGTYMIYNPQSVLAKSLETFNFIPGAPWEFDHVLLVQIKDPDKVRDFLKRFNAAYEKSFKAKPKSAGTDLYTVEPVKGLTISYGLVGTTFIGATSSGLDAAIDALKGEKSLLTLGTWKTAMAAMTDPVSAMGFLNVDPLYDALKILMSKQKVDPKQYNPYVLNEQNLAMINYFESAGVSLWWQNNGGGVRLQLTVR